MGSIHKFTLNGKNLVFDVESGALHEFDAAAWRALDLIEAGLDEAAAVEAMRPEFGAEAADGALAEIKKLKDEGLLWSEPRRPAGGVAPRVKALCLFLSEDCNLSCRYCFVEGGLRPPARKHMSETVGRAAIDFDQGFGPARPLRSGLFGGEPLLNFSALQASPPMPGALLPPPARDRLYRNQQRPPLESRCGRLPGAGRFYTILSRTAGRRCMTGCGGAQAAAGYNSVLPRLRAYMERSHRRLLCARHLYPP